MHRCRGADSSFLRVVVLSRWAHFPFCLRSNQLRLRQIMLAPVSSFSMQPLGGADNRLDPAAVWARAPLIVPRVLRLTSVARHVRHSDGDRGRKMAHLDTQKRSPEHLKSHNPDPACVQKRRDAASEQFRAREGFY